MKTWQWFILILGAGVILVSEVVMWSIQPLAFWFFPSWIYIAVVMHLLPWPRSVYLAFVLGVLVDCYAPAPFGLWTISLIVLVVVDQWIHTTWLKQASALSVLIAIFGGLIAATIPFWIWQIMALRSSAISSVILQVSWWHWPAGWIIMSLLAAIFIRILPSRYERFV